MQINSNIKIILIIISIIILYVFVLFYLITRYGDVKTVSIINKLFDSCNQPAIFNPNDFEWTKNFRNNWEVILNEFNVYRSKYNTPYHQELNKYVSGCDTAKSWKTLYLRAFNRNTEVANFFRYEILIKSCTFIRTNLRDHLFN